LELPRVQSQYLHQAENTNAPILRLHYEQGNVQLHSPEGLLEFSQENVTKLLVDVQRTHSPARRLLAANVRLQAPAQLPISYLNDLFFWLRIGGCTRLYLAAQAPFQPNQTPYLSIPIAPFPLNGKIYDNVAAAQKVHPNTSFLDARFDWDWYFEELDKKPIAYVPSFLETVTLQEGQILFREQQVNPMVFSTMVQGALAQQYGSSYEKATPKAYWSLLVQLEEKATYQEFITLMESILEGYHLYWEDLAFAKHQKTYLELEPAVRWEVQQAAPLLPLYYDALQAAELAPLYELTPALWSELERY
jgi:hypothetical protein